MDNLEIFDSCVEAESPTGYNIQHLRRGKKKESLRKAVVVFGYIAASIIAAALTIFAIAVWVCIFVCIYNEISCL